MNEQQSQPQPAQHVVSSARARIVHGALLGASAAALLVVFLTIGGELWGPLKQHLADEHYHHWVGKGVWATITFFVISAISALGIKSTDSAVTRRLVILLSWTLMLSFVLLFGFYLYEYFHHV